MIECAISPTIRQMDLALQGDILFCLGNYCKMYPEYYSFFKRHGGDRFTIVDNGAYEFGKPLEGEDYLNIFKQVSGSELVAPDVEFDFDQTKELTRKFLKFLDSKDVDIEIQLVLQGKDYGDLINNSAEFISEEPPDPRISSYGVPLYNKKWQERAAAVKVLGQLSKRPIHLLGLHDPLELAFYNRKDNVRSADGGFAVKFAGYNIQWSMDEELPLDKKNHIDKLDITDLNRDAFEHNLKVLRSFSRRCESEYSTMPAKASMK